MLTTEPTVIDYERSAVVLVATSIYDDSKFQQVPAASNSLNEIRRVLIDPDLGGWPVDRVFSFENNRNAGRVASEIRRIAESAPDVLIFYYVGHGLLTSLGELCLCVSDTEYDSADFTGIRYSWIKETFSTSASRVMVSILDCCSAGRAIQALSGDRGLLNSVAAEGIYTLVATEGTASAHVVELEKQASRATSFTEEFVGLLDHGMPGLAPWLTLDNIYTRLRQQLARKGLPKPSQSVVGTVHNFYFSRNKAVANRISNISTASATDYFQRAVREDYVFEFPAWPRGMREPEYNTMLSFVYPTSLLMDRTLLSLPAGSHDKFEPCDLLGPNSELIHIKRTVTSSSVGHLVSQALVSTELLATSRELRESFARIVQERSSQHVIPVDQWPKVVILGASGINNGKDGDVNTMSTSRKLLIGHAAEVLARLNVTLHIVSIAES
ncbi:MAG TPA: DUF6119 family protein [Pseudonocardiaceae bacterium]|nr:DUF6119 family protein [Pseudonocardiaceae bacterium]